MKTKCHYCGEEFSYRGGKSHYNRTRHHYCSRSCQAKGNNRLKGNKIHGLAGTRKYELWCWLKRRAKKKEVRFNIGVEDIPDIPDFCPVLNIPIKANDAAGPLDSSPSIDRIIPELGYVKGNIRVVSNRANRLKADATLEEMELVLQDLRNINHAKEKA